MAASHRRLLPAALGAMGLLLAVKLTALADTPRASSAVEPPRAAGAAPAAEPRLAPRDAKPATQAPAAFASPASPAPAQCGPEAQQPTPEQRAERELLQSLRARRAELDAREQALVTRELAAEAAERRTTQHMEELASLQRQATAGDRERAEREEQGWRQMVKLYEGLRPRDAAAIFNELDLVVLVPIMDRMRETKAAPILGSMRPERARALTAELARHRARAGE